MLSSNCSKQARPVPAGRPNAIRKVSSSLSSRSIRQSQFFAEPDTGRAFVQIAQRIDSQLESHPRMHGLEMDDIPQRPFHVVAALVLWSLEMYLEHGGPETRGGPEQDD